CCFHRAPRMKRERGNLPGTIAGRADRRKASHAGELLSSSFAGTLSYVAGMELVRPPLGGQLQVAAHPVTAELESTRPAASLCLERASVAVGLERACGAVGNAGQGAFDARHLQAAPEHHGG